MMKRRDLLRSAGALLAGLMTGRLFSAGAASAHEYEIGKLIVEHPWIRAPKPGESKAYLYAFIHNEGAEPDRLIGATGEKFGNFEIYPDARSSAKGKGILIPPNATTTLAPGGAYVLLLDIKKHLEVGWGLELTLKFEKAGEVVIDAAIEAPDAAHAHDAEAAARWEKAQASGSAPATTPPAGGHDHDHDHHHP
jgi:periplasmic copper chaperone A